LPRPQGTGTFAELKP